MFKWEKLKTIRWGTEEVLSATNTLKVPVPIIDLAQKLDIEVYTYNGWTNETSEMAHYDGVKKPHIYVNARHNKIEQRTSISKGISEILCNFTPNVPKTTSNPNSKLTSSWLIPFYLLKQNIDLWGWDYLLLAEVFNVPNQMMLHRISELRRSMGDRYI